MPKIIENLKERLLSEVERQLAEGGYEAVTVRSIAKGCGVGLGTVYNYFPSKDALIAANLLEDWNGCMEEIRRTAEYFCEIRPVLQCMHGQLAGFYDRHTSVFRSEAAASGFACAVSRYHDLLRSQLAEPLQGFCRTEFAADRIDDKIRFTDDALELMLNVPRIFLPTALKGCVEWARENNVELITAAEMKIINDKRAKEKQKK